MSPSRSRRRRPRKKKSHTKKIILIVALLAVVVTAVVAYNMLGNNEDSPNGNTQKTKVLLETTKGNITIELRNDMPITTANFINLTQQGVYDNTIFHRVKDDFMIQGGDPTGTGYGDPSIPSIPDEFSNNPENNKNKRGTVAMANAGPNTGSSQFFVNVVYNSHLDNIHPVFGDVIEGIDVADEISLGPANATYYPDDPVTLIRATVIE